MQGQLVLSEETSGFVAIKGEGKAIFYRHQIVVFAQSWVEALALSDYLQRPDLLGSSWGNENVHAQHSKVTALSSKVHHRTGELETFLLYSHHVDYAVPQDGE